METESCNVPDIQVNIYLLQLQEKSVLDLLVVASETEENGTLTDNQILSHCLNFLFAAYDTTSLTLTCVSHLLATNTHVQDKLCALLDDYWSQHEVFTCTDPIHNNEFLTV